VLGLEVRKQDFKKVLPNSGPLPLTKVAQAGESGRERSGGRKVTPRDACPQDEQNSSNDPPKVAGFSSGKLNMTILPWLGEQRLQAFPKAVGQDGSGHDEDLLMWSSSTAS